MGEFNHTCKVCGKGYNACDTCVNEKNFAPWRAVACEQGHFQAYMVLHEYGSGLLKKSVAKEMLDGINLDGWEKYPEHNRVVLAEILQEDKKPVVEGKVEQTIPQPAQPQREHFVRFPKRK